MNTEDWCWSWNSNALTTWCKELIHWKKPCCWERLKVGGEEDNRGWNHWLASLTGWTWVWASSGSWWWTGKPGMLRPWGLRESDMAEQLNWTELNSAYKLNKQGDHIPLCFTHFPIWNQSVVPCPVLTIASWPAYGFLWRQIRWSGVPISLRIFQFVVIHTDRMERGCQIELQAKE